MNSKVEHGPGLARHSCARTALLYLPLYEEDYVRRPKYVMFDCDGVLVDSEPIANRVEAEIKTELGYPITYEEQIRRFCGRGTNHPDYRHEMRKFPANYDQIVDSRIRSVYEAELQPIAGILELLDVLQAPKCVASSSELAWIEIKLGLTGLKPHFPKKTIFSGHMVERGKPEPDLFLFAARQMGWDPSECLVVEDSVPGVQAARAAGMKVVGFIGGGHVLPGHADRLKTAGAEKIVSDIRLVWRLLQ